MRLPALLAALLLLAGRPAAADTVTVTDLAGRTLEITRPVERIMLGEGRYLTALAILDRDDPTRRLAGMLGEYERLDPAGYAQYLARFPRLAGVPRIGHTSGHTVSVEKAVTTGAQVAFLGLGGHGPSLRTPEIVGQLEAAGIAVVFVDFRRDPLAGTPLSIELMGRVLGREAEAGAFAGHYREQLAVVDAGLAGLGDGDRPTVFLESRVGLSEQCCETMARQMLGALLTRAGGANIADALLPGTVGTVSLEYLLANPPQVYIGTAIGNAGAQAAGARIQLGAGVSAATALASLRRAAARPGIAALPAVRQGRAYAVWHHFYNSPLQVAAVQAMAKWLHPGRFAGLDPEATLRRMHERFLPIPYDGTYWIGMPPE